MLGRRIIDLESVSGLFDCLLLTIDHGDQLASFAWVYSLVASFCLLGYDHGLSLRNCLGA